MTRRKEPGERKKPGPRPGFKRAAASSAAPAEQPAPEAPQTRFPDPLQRNRSIDTMGEAELRAYALQLGLTPRDARDLSVERLRVNCKHQVHALIDDL